MQGLETGFLGGRGCLGPMGQRGFEIIQMPALDLKLLLDGGFQLRQQVALGGQLLAQGRNLAGHRIGVRGRPLDVIERGFEFAEARLVGLQLFGDDIPQVAEILVLGLQGFLDLSLIHI